MVKLEQKNECCTNNIVKDDKVANSDGLSDTLQQCDVIHVIGDIIYISHLSAALSILTMFTYQSLFQPRSMTCKNTLISTFLALLLTLIKLAVSLKSTCLNTYLIIKQLSHALHSHCLSPFQFK